MYSIHSYFLFMAVQITNFIIIQINLLPVADFKEWLVNKLASDVCTVADATCAKPQRLLHKVFL